MSSPNDSINFVVELEGRDRIEVSGSQVRFRGCSELTGLMKQLRGEHGPELGQWPLPEGTSHSEILIREAILKAKGEWKFPYQEAEVCHCRGVACRTVDQAIIAGAHSTDVVSRQTSTSTACGTCRPDVQKMIQYRVHGPAQSTPLKKTA
jgi:bacterioferritin-associated ferredoxin